MHTIAAAILILAGLVVALQILGTLVQALRRAKVAGWAGPYTRAVGVQNWREQ